MSHCSTLTKWMSTGTPPKGTRPLKLSLDVLRLLGRVSLSPSYHKIRLRCSSRFRDSGFTDFLVSLFSPFFTFNPPSFRPETLVTQIQC